MKMQAGIRFDDGEREKVKMQVGVEIVVRER